jgi:nifR3 family TIM-barrel protein
MAYWYEKKTPIIGLSPMDGVTDSAFRAVVDHIGHPDVLFTEFVSADGLSRNVPRLFSTFVSHKTNTPVVGQIFGKNPDAMAKAVPFLKNYPLAGIDINMGCPAKTVSGHGAGAGLIRTPEIAVEIITSVKQAVSDLHWDIPVTVKTRVGYDTPVTEWWMETLLSAKPQAITLHGRTLKQLYSGLASWEEIAKASTIVRNAGVAFFGNGDIHSRADALERIRAYNLTGILIGRASFGNPWVFTGHEPTLTERIDAALLHLSCFEQLQPTNHVMALRKHMAWYIKGFPNASELRAKLVTFETIDDARRILNGMKHDLMNSTDS